MNKQRGDDTSQHHERSAFSILITLCSLSPDSYDELVGLFTQMDEADEDDDGQFTKIDLDGIEDERVKQLLIELFVKYWYHLITRVGDDNNQLVFAKRTDAPTGILKEFRYVVPETIKYSVMIPESVSSSSSNLIEQSNGAVVYDKESSGTHKQQEQLTKRTSGPTLPPNYVNQEQLREQYDEYNAKYRSKSLVEVRKELNEDKERERERRERKRERKRQKREERERRHREKKERGERKKRKRRHSDSESYTSDTEEEEDRRRRHKEKKRRRKEKEREKRKEDGKRKKSKSHKYSDSSSASSEEESDNERKRNLSNRGYLTFNRDQDMAARPIDKQRLNSIMQSASKFNDRFSSSGFQTSFI